MRLNAGEAVLTKSTDEFKELIAILDEKGYRFYNGAPITTAIVNERSGARHLDNKLYSYPDCIATLSYSMYTDGEANGEFDANGTSYTAISFEEFLSRGSDGSTIDVLDLV